MGDGGDDAGQATPATPGRTGLAQIDRPGVWSKFTSRLKRESHKLSYG